MLRLLILLAVVIGSLSLGVDAALAQQGGAWPAIDINPSNFRGPGFYLSWVKILACWLVFAAWVKTADWVSTDCQDLKLDYLRWNPIVFGSFFAAFVLLWLIPFFWLGFPLLIIAYVAPFATYVVYRNKQVTNDQRVFTPEHLRYWLATRLNRVGIKMKAEKISVHEAGPPAKLRARGGPDEVTDKANTLKARQFPGFRDARQIVADGLSSRASAIMLDYSQQGVAVRHMIDGVWINREALDREMADPALEAMKTVAGLNPQDRRSRQEGGFIADYQALAYTGTLTTQGTKTGERVLMQLVDEKVRFKTFDELGMRPKMEEQLRELLRAEQGLMLFSAMPATGLRTTMDIALHSTDRLMREFLGVEADNNRYEDVENIPITTYKAEAGETPATVLPKLFRLHPDVIVVRDLVNGETLKLLCETIGEKRLVISTQRAKDNAEALLRVMSLGVPANQFAKNVIGVLNQRLVRKLCDSCKEAYMPPENVLKQLGIPAGRVQAFYRPPQQPEEVCEVCGGIGYVGRTAIFELLVVGDTVRKVLASSPKLDLLRQAARKDGMRSLQEEGILLVAKGTTSLPELMRILKQ